jgi:hypothetical protein
LDTCNIPIVGHPIAGSDARQLAIVRFEFFNGIERSLEIRRSHLLDQSRGTFSTTTTRGAAATSHTNDVRIVGKLWLGAAIG